MSLWQPYDVTSDIPHMSLSVSQSMIKRGGVTVAKTGGLSDRTGAERLNTVTYRCAV